MKHTHIVYVREGDVGRCAVVDGSHRFSIGQRVMMFRPNVGVILPRFLLLQLMSSPVLDDQVRSGKTGATAHHVNIKQLRQIRINVPSLMEQQCIVDYLNSFQAKVDTIKRLQAVSAIELDALLPAVLARAFRGEL
ncbi:MAG: restriction endonuclease subunit S [Chloroflexota bacterium]|nr:restriction endonuclease subunit S [Chloroflexota bacterium]